MHAYIHTCIHAFNHAYIPACIHPYTHTCTHTHARAHSRSHAHTQTHTHAHTRTHTHTHHRELRGDEMRLQTDVVNRVKPGQVPLPEFQACCVCVEFSMCMCACICTRPWMHARVKTRTHIPLVSLLKIPSIAAKQLFTRMSSLPSSWLIFLNRPSISSCCEWSTCIGTGMPPRSRIAAAVASRRPRLRDVIYTCAYALVSTFNYSRFFAYVHALICGRGTCSHKGAR